MYKRQVADDAAAEPEREPITDPEIVDAEIVEDETTVDGSAEETENEEAPADEPDESDQSGESDEGAKRGVAKPLSQELEAETDEEQNSSIKDSPAEGERD